MQLLYSTWKSILLSLQLCRIRDEILVKKHTSLNITISSISATHSKPRDKNAALWSFSKSILGIHMQWSKLLLLSNRLCTLRVCRKPNQTQSARCFNTIHTVFCLAFAKLPEQLYMRIAVNKWSANVCI